MGPLISKVENFNLLYGSIFVGVKNSTSNIYSSVLKDVGLQAFFRLCHALASSLQTLPHPLCQTLFLFVLVHSPVSSRMYVLSILCDVPSATYAVRSSFIKDLFFYFLHFQKTHSTRSFF